MSQDEAPVPDEKEPVPLDDYDDLEPLSLADEDPTGSLSGMSSTKIQAFGTQTDALLHKQQYKRIPTLSGTGAVRCRLFHSKITLGALDHMTNSINEWLDENEIEVKYVAQVVGTMEGKTPEPNVIITVWY